MNNDKIPFEEQRVKFSKVIEEEIKKFLVTKKQHKNFLDTLVYNVMDEYVLRGGKRLRAIMAITAYQGITHDFNYGPIYFASSSWEFMDVALLAQDDVIDRSSTRRGGDSCHVIIENSVKPLVSTDNENYKSFSEGAAFIIGDIFLLWGMQMVNLSDFPLEIKNEALMTYINASEIVAKGELKDMYYGLAPNKCTEDEYLYMIEEKTVHYVTLNQALFGLKLAKASQEQIDACYSYTHPLGMAFQIRDDLLDLLATDARFGKPIGNDIKEGKATIPVIYSLAHANKTDRKILEKALGNRDATREQIDDAIKVLINSGGIEQAYKRINNYKKIAQKGLMNLEKVGFHEHIIQIYEDLNTWVLERTF